MTGPPAAAAAAAASSASPLVSVAVITYNQEDTIAQTVLSILGQECEFDFEVVIGEDCSTDGTRAVLRDLAARHPGRLRLIEQERNVGFMANARAVFGALRGEFGAILEGDDYWIASDKLARQVDALRRHPGSDMCFSAAMLRTPDDRMERGFDYGPVERVVTTSEFCRQTSMMIPTGSLMFRTARLHALPPVIYGAPVLDAFLALGFAARGGAVYLPKETSVYRIAAPGSWTERMARIGKAEFESYCERMIAAYEQTATDFRLTRKDVAERTRGLRWDLLRLRQKDGRLAGALSQVRWLGPAFLAGRMAALVRQWVSSRKRHKEA